MFHIGQLLLFSVIFRGVYGSYFHIDQCYEFTILFSCVATVLANAVTAGFRIGPLQRLTLRYLPHSALTGQFKSIALEYKKEDILLLISLGHAPDDCSFNQVVFRSGDTAENEVECLSKYLYYLSLSTSLKVQYFCTIRNSVRSHDKDK